VLEDRFSMVPEWVLDADIGDCALRLYAVLLRYCNTTGARMPARTTVARLAVTRLAASAEGNLRG
jgi:hypothetical protein